MAWLLAAFAFAFPVSAQGVRSNAAVEDDRDAARERIEAIEKDIARRREAVLSSGSDYQRLKAQRALEQSEQALREAKDALETAKRALKPGTEAWNQELLIKDGRQFRSIPGRDKKKEEDEYRYGVSVPDVGPGEALDPRVHQNNWVGEPGSSRAGGAEPIRLPTVPTAEDGIAGTPGVAPAGEVQYGRPAGYRNSPLGPIRDPREGLSPKKEKENGLRYAPLPPSTATAGGELEKPDEGGPIAAAAAFGDRGRPLPPLALDGFTFDAPEGELLKLFPKLSRSPEGDRRIGVRLVREAGRLLAAGNPAGALREADRLAELAPADPGVHELRARILNRLQRFSDAERAALQALRFEPGRVSAWKALSWAQLHGGKPEEALKSAERALSLDPDDAAAAALRAYALERLGRRAEALRAIAKAAALHPAGYGAAAANAAAGAAVSPGGMAASKPGPAPRPPDAPIRFPFAAGAAGAALAGGIALSAWWLVGRWK